jgi:hypothetical protein
VQVVDRQPVELGLAARQLVARDQEVGSPHEVDGDPGGSAAAGDRLVDLLDELVRVEDPFAQVAGQAVEQELLERALLLLGEQPLVRFDLFRECVPTRTGSWPPSPSWRWRAPLRSGA